MSNVAKFNDKMDMKYLGNGWILTHLGKRFHLEQPEFDLEDMAYALARICRYNGHLKGWRSVAEHSVNVTRILQVLYGDSLSQAHYAAALLHDGTEAYLSDIPAPFKQYIPEWRAINDRLEVEMAEQFGLDLHTPEIQEADTLEGFMEAYYVMPDRGESFSDPHGMRKRALDLVFNYSQLIPRCMSFDEATEEFLFAAKHYGLR